MCSSRSPVRSLHTQSPPPTVRTPPSNRAVRLQSCPVVPPPLPPRNTRQQVPRTMSTPPVLGKASLSPSARPLPALPQLS